MHTISNSFNSFVCCDLQQIDVAHILRLESVLGTPHPTHLPTRARIVLDCSLEPA